MDGTDQSSISRGSTGVFLCTCSGSVSKVINLDEVAKFIRNGKACGLVEIHDRLCESDGLSAIHAAIKREGLECVIIGGCSPKLNEQLFREELERAGLNPLLLEMANLREQCAWVHPNEPSSATEKAKLLVAGSVERSKFLGEAKSVAPKTMRFKQPIARRDLLRALFRLLKEYRATATINNRICGDAGDGCKYCVEGCPFQAIHLGASLAVDEDLCRACGICSAVCPVGAIQMPTFTDEQLVAQLRGLLADDDTKLGPRVVVFSCDGHSYSAADAVGAEGLSYPPNVLIVRVPCIGAISEVHILKALELGAAGVLLSGCPSGTCPYTNGNDVASRVHDLVGNILSAFGLPKSVEIVENFGDGPQSFADSVSGFMQRVLPVAHDISRIRGDTLGGATRRESLLNLLKGFSARSGITPSLRESDTPHPFAEIEIDAEKCTACGICVRRCPTRAIKSLEKGNVVQLNFIYGQCIACGICKSACPENAVELYRILDLRSLVEVSGRTLVEQKFVACTECGKSFVPVTKLELVSKTVQKNGVTIGEYLDFMKMCHECRTKALLVGRSHG